MMQQNTLRVFTPKRSATNSTLQPHNERVQSQEKQKPGESYNSPYAMRNLGITTPRIDWNDLERPSPLPDTQAAMARKARSPTKTLKNSLEYDPHYANAHQHSPVQRKTWKNKKFLPPRPRVVYDKLARSHNFETVDQGLLKKQGGIYGNYRNEAEALNKQNDFHVEPATIFDSHHQNILKLSDDVQVQQDRQVCMFDDPYTESDTPLLPAPVELKAPKSPILKNKSRAQNNR